ncbi:MAG: BsuPI-related putative proteinase inhibitor [Capsulimonadaceae bacterium]|nr:BsuPI-related putative proteinase inhibitor [Capsulimonadaceae bacterium]
MTSRMREFMFELILGTLLIAAIFLAAEPVLPAPSQSPSPLLVSLPHATMPVSAAARLTMARAVYASAAVVDFTFEITNTGSRPISYSFNSAQNYEVVITNVTTRKAVWHYSHGKKFDPLVSKLTLRPGETHSFSIGWLQCDDSGAPVPPGAYQANAILIPMSRLLLTSGFIVDVNTDPANTGMPTKSDVETGATVATNVTPNISARTSFTIMPPYDMPPSLTPAASSLP